MIEFLLPALFAADEGGGGFSLMTGIKTALFTLKGVVGLFGLYCVIWMMQLFSRRAFASKKQEREYVEQTCQLIDQGQFDAAYQLASSPKNWFRGLAMLVRYALENRTMPMGKLQHLVAIRLDTEVMAGVEPSIATVNTCIKAAPMLGLFGTVVAMIGAFGTISQQASPDATKLGADIALALNATAVGLFVAIMLMLTVNFALVKRRRTEDTLVMNVQEILLHLDAAPGRNGR